MAQISVERLALLTTLTALSAAHVGIVERRPGVEAVIGVRSPMLRYWEGLDKLLMLYPAAWLVVDIPEALPDLPQLAIGRHHELLGRCLQVSDVSP